MPGSFCKAIKISLKAFRLAGKLQLAKAHSINHPTISSARLIKSEESTL